MEYFQEAQKIALLHHPSGPYCVNCDYVKEFPGNIGEVSNPQCSHFSRSCATCWDHEDKKTLYPCPTIQVVALMDETGLVAQYLKQWGNLVLND